MSANLSNSLYLVTIVTFILALRFLSSPRRARLGNQLGAAGMLLAIVVTLAQDGLEGYEWIALAMAIGGVVGCGRRAPREDDRDAADGGALQRRRRRRGRADRARGVPQPRAGSRAGWTSTSRWR